MPDESVAIALKVTSPVPRLVSSLSLNTTAILLPVLVKDLLIEVTPVLLKTTEILLPNSDNKFTTPVADFASAFVAPSLIPVASDSIGEEGASVSSAKVLEVVVLVLPAASFFTTLTLIVPLPSVAKSCAVSGTACSLPFPVMYFTTLLLLLLRLKVISAVSPEARLPTLIRPLVSASARFTLLLVKLLSKLNVTGLGLLVSTIYIGLSAALVIPEKLIPAKFLILPPFKLRPLIAMPLLSLRPLVMV